MLRLHVLRTVLADDFYARLGERLHVVDGDVLRGGDDGDARPDLFDDALVALTDRIR
jgi:hypothetical protein